MAPGQARERCVEQGKVVQAYQSEPRAKCRDRTAAVDDHGESASDTDRSRWQELGEHKCALGVASVFAIHIDRREATNV
jgi:hypothetical protein